MMKIISWNCRGLGSGNKKELFQILVRKESPQILLLQETKMKDVYVLQDNKTIWKESTSLVVSSKGPPMAFVPFGTHRCSI
jgi:exonuclease III